MSAQRRRSARDERRRTYGQNFLVDPSVAERAVARADIASGDLVVDVGAGRGALTIPLARAGARVVAVERDRRFAGELRQRLGRERLAGTVRVITADFRAVRMPDPPYRVVACPPYGLTTALLARLLDDPERGPIRADLLLQAEVARKRAARPPTTLRSAAWAPWWSFELGEPVPRGAFRPVPSVDSSWLTIRRRDPPVLPTHMANGFAEVLRPTWTGERGAR